MRKVSYIFLAIGLALCLLTGCEKAEMETEDNETENVITIPVIDSASETEEAKEDEFQKNEEKESDNVIIGSQPDYISDYETPQKFSKNMFDYIIKVGSDPYQLPAPVNAFIANGWEFEDNILNHKLQASEDKSYITMTRDGTKISVRIANYDTEEHIYKNCVVVSVQSKDNIIETSFGTLDSLQEISSIIEDYTDEGIHYTNYAVKDYLYCSQGYFFNYVDNQL